MSMTEFYVRVRPDSDEFDVEEDIITEVSLTQPAENGRANAELIEKLSGVLGEKTALVSGHRSGRKKLKVDMPEEEVREKLRNF